MVVVILFEAKRLGIFSMVLNTYRHFIGPSLFRANCLLFASK